LHSTLVALIYRFLLGRLPAGVIIRQEQPLTLADSELEPDIAVVCGVDLDFLKAHPTTAELVIEVALANPELDRANASIYAEAEVKEYWLLLGEKRRTEVYRQPQGGRYREKIIVGLNEVLQCSTIPGLHLLPSELRA
jgi:Uma2 family endonuclease